MHTYVGRDFLDSLDFKNKLTRIQPSKMEVWVLSMHRVSH